MKIADMGEIWKKYSNTPIPLGFIVIKRSIPEEVSLKVNRILKRSIDYASRNPLASSEFVASNAREMESDVMKKHIDLYVNEYTAELGIKGRQAIDKLFHVAGRSGVVPDLPPRIFLTSVG
jgi:1,4-dihydroxy-6-naphthoate synthase